MRVVDGAAKLIPDQVPPLLKDGSEGWPPGWGTGRRVRSQRDIFELLSLPYREPADRDCP